LHKAARCSRHDPFFSAIKVGVVFGGRVQSLLTVLKILGIFVIVGGVFFFAHGSGWTIFAPGGRGPWRNEGFGAAMPGSLWAYDGWNNMPMVAGEVNNPGRNVPRAHLRHGGSDCDLLLPILHTLALLFFAEVVTWNSTAHRDALPVATKAAQTFAGEAGGRLVTVAFLLSAMGALNGSILTGARVPFAMARDGMFFRPAGQLTKGSRVPAISIMMQAVWASVLAISGTFDQLTDYVIFASWIFYGLTTSSVFVLRRKMPLAERPYKTLGYPVVPLVFVLVAIWLIYNTLQTSPVESAAGLVLIGLGLPLYFFYRWRRNTNPAHPTATDTPTD
jgi:APA family basic amino acid/polyamine antiporter